MSDKPLPDSVRAMLDLDSRSAKALPNEKPPRIDMSRCVVYPVSKASEAMGLFKAKYHVEPTFCIASNIGGKRAIEAWIVGFLPEDTPSGE